jgi:predicted MFS family arabinose efflux permease
MSPQTRIMMIFALQPLALGSWLPQIPDVQLRLGMGPADLSLALLGFPAGLLTALPFGGRIAAAFGARKLIFFGLPVYLALMSLPPLAPSAPLLFASLACAGASIAFLELGLNLQADEIEKSGDRLIMSACHGFWSVGIMAGSLAGAGLAMLALPPFAAVAWTALFSLPVGLALAFGLPVEGAHAASNDSNAAAPWRLPGKALIAISLFTFGITMTEGAVADWSGIFLRDAFGSPSGASGLGYTAFAAMVAAGRFMGDRLKARLGAVTCARLCGAMALAGLGCVLASPSAGLAVVGFALTGIGVSVGFPLAVTAAAGLTDRPAASSVAILTFIALLGFLVGPPAIGFVAEYGGIRAGLAMLLPGLAASFVLAAALGGAKPSENMPSKSGTPEHV